jgi:hypothetical protein
VQETLLIMKIRKFHNCTVKLKGTKLHLVVDLSKMMMLTRTKGIVNCSLPYKLTTMGPYKIFMKLLVGQVGMKIPVTRTNFQRTKTKKSLARLLEEQINEDTMHG